MIFERRFTIRFSNDLPTFLSSADHKLPCTRHIELSSSIPHQCKQCSFVAELHLWLHSNNTEDRTANSRFFAGSPYRLLYFISPLFHILHGHHSAVLAPDVSFVNCRTAFDAQGIGFAVLFEVHSSSSSSHSISFCSAIHFVIHRSPVSPSLSIESSRT